MKSVLLCVLFLILAPISSSAFVTLHANASLTSFLSTYLSNTAIANSTFIQMSFRNNTYLLMNITPSKHMLINTTNGFSFVLNSISASSILKPTLVALYYPNQTILSRLNSTMHGYINEAAPPLTDCFILTGLDRFNATLENGVFSCQTVPKCREAMYVTGGPSGPFGLGIINFSVQYNKLNSSYSAYFATLSDLSQSSITSNLAKLSSYLANVSSLAVQMPQNPLFPIPANMSPSQFSSCIYYTPTTAPWYCVAIGYCQYTSFNSTRLASLQSLINGLLAEPLTSSNIKTFANSTISTTNLYVEPVLRRLNTDAFNAFISATLPRYNATVANVTLLLSRFQNTSLNQSLAELETTFTAFRAASINQNITAASLTMNSLLENISSAYAQFNSLYMPVFSKAFNTSLLVVLRELDYGQLPTGLAQIAAQDQQVTSELARRVSPSELSTIENSIMGINLNATSYQGEASMPAFVKAVDGPFVVYLLSASPLPVGSKIGSGALYAALLSFIIGTALLMLFYILTYHRLHRAKRIRHTKRVRRAWHLLFVVLFILVLVYTYETYAYASLATSFLPISGFFARAASSNTIVVAINTNSANVLNVSVVNCATALRKTLTALNKSVQSMQLSNYTCVSSSTSNTVAPNCYDVVLSSGTPAIQLNANASSYITNNGLYGTVLQASGSPTYGGSCLLASLVKYALK